MQNISLLYAVPEKQSADYSGIMYNLLLDRLADRLDVNVARQKAFVETLKRPCTAEENIRYRQDILKDLTVRREFFSLLYSASCKIEKQRKAFKEDKAKVYMLKRQSHETTEAATNQLLLEIGATHLRATLVILAGIHELFGRYSVTAPGLLSLDRNCALIAESPDYPKALEVLEQLSNTSDAGNPTYICEINSQLMLSECKILKFSEWQGEAKKSFFSRFTGKAEKAIPFSGAVLSDQETLAGIAAEAYANMGGIIEKTLTTLLETVANLRYELMFYDMAMKYIDAVTNLKYPLCYPAAAQNGTRALKIDSLYDLTLILGGENVIPNDVGLDSSKRGILITGENNSGKTVYLRSIGTACIFYQAGMPICAKSAEMSVMQSFHSQFAAAEKTDEPELFGRFEQEVSEVAAMVDEISDNSLVLLNETFQTTSYDEGTDGMIPILDYLTAKNSIWIFVSHLKKLIGTMRDNRDVILLQSDADGCDKYKMKEL